MTIIRTGSYDTQKFKFQDIIRVGSMFGEIMMLEDDNANVSGYIEIMDMTGVTAANLFALQPQLLSKFSAFADEAMPTRQKGIHFINVPASFESGFKSLRSFFPDKVKNRVSHICRLPSDQQRFIVFLRRYLSAPIRRPSLSVCVASICPRNTAAAGAPCKTS